jgi:hypothetical protein
MRDVLDFLKAELAFLESGGYEQPPGAAWQAVLVFEDSPNCLNFDPSAPERPCSECPLINFVPERRRNEEIPCRFIPLNPEGQTLESLYRTAPREETLETVRSWLKKTIAQLERESETKAS